VPKMWPYE